MKLRALLVKDLKVLKRTPAITVLLALYPALVAILIGLAVGKPPSKPVVAIVNNVPQDQRKLKIGGKRFDLDKLVRALYNNVDAHTVKTRAEAVREVQTGDAVAAVIIPEDIVDDLESALGQGHLEAVFDSSDAIRKSYVETTIKGLLVDTNKELTSRFSGVALDYLDIIVNGGKIGFGGKTYKILGLKEGQTLLPKLIPYIPPAQRDDVMQLARSTGLAKTGLKYSDQLLNRVGEPIRLTQKPVGTASSVPSLAVAVAVSVSSMFVALLLGAGMLAYEQEDQMLIRLLRGLVKRRTVVAEKTILAGLAALVVGTVMVLAFSVFVDVRIERVWAWLPALVGASLGFGVAGVAVGAASGDVRAASLASFMLGLPLAAAALVPKSSIGASLYDVLQVISAMFPFKPALDLVTAGLSPGNDALTPLLHLAALLVAYGALASWAIRRRAAV